MKIEDVKFTFTYYTLTDASMYANLCHKDMVSVTPLGTPRVTISESDTNSELSLQSTFTRSVEVGVYSASGDTLWSLEKPESNRTKTSSPSRDTSLSLCHLDEQPKQEATEKEDTTGATSASADHHHCQTNKLGKTSASTEILDEMDAPQAITEPCPDPSMPAHVASDTCWPSRHYQRDTRSLPTFGVLKFSFDEISDEISNGISMAHSFHKEQKCTKSKMCSTGMIPSTQCGPLDLEFSTFRIRSFVNVENGMKKLVLCDKEGKPVQSNTSTGKPTIQFKRSVEDVENGIITFVFDRNESEDDMESDDLESVVSKHQHPLFYRGLKQNCLTDPQEFLIFSDDDFVDKPQEEKCNVMSTRANAHSLVKYLQTRKAALLKGKQNRVKKYVPMTKNEKRSNDTVVGQNDLSETALSWSKTEPHQTRMNRKPYTGFKLYPNPQYNMSGNVSTLQRSLPSASKEDMYMRFSDISANTEDVSDDGSKTSIQQVDSYKINHRYSIDRMREWKVKKPMECRMEISIGRKLLRDAIKRKLEKNWVETTLVENRHANPRRLSMLNPNTHLAATRDKNRNNWTTISIPTPPPPPPLPIVHPTKPKR